jgi:hypothetical protein
MSSWFAKNRMLPLWLQTHSKGKVLWAVNKEHLDFLEHYVSERLRKPPFSYNSMIAARMPRYLAEKSRERIAPGSQAKGETALELIPRGLGIPARTCVPRIRAQPIVRH